MNKLKARLQEPILSWDPLWRKIFEIEKPLHEPLDDESKFVRIDNSGEAELVTLDKHQLVSQLGIRYRDLIAISPTLLYPSPAAILIRQKAILANLEATRMIISSNECYVLSVPSSTDPSVATLPTLDHPFIVHLARCLAEKQQPSNNTTGPKTAEEMCRESMPFELRALEAALRVCFGVIEAETHALEQRSNTAIDRLLRNVGRDVLESVRSEKNGVDRLRTRLQRIQQEVDEILSDDLDMADLYLSRKEEESPLNEDRALTAPIYFTFSGEPDENGETEKAYMSLRQTTAATTGRVHNEDQTSAHSQHPRGGGRDDDNNDDNNNGDNKNITTLGSDDDGSGGSQDSQVVQESRLNLPLDTNVHRHHNHDNNRRNQSSEQQQVQHSSQQHRRRYRSGPRRHARHIAQRSNSSSNINRTTPFADSGAAEFIHDTEAFKDNDDDNGSQHNSVFSFTSADLHVHPDDIQEAEDLLESFHIFADALLHRLNLVDERIDDAEDLLEIELDHRRNQIFTLNLVVSTISMSFAYFAAISGMFGMNLYNSTWSDSVTAFVVVVCALFIGTAFLFVGTILYVKAKGLLFIPQT